MLLVGGWSAKAAAFYLWPGRRVGWGRWSRGSDAREPLAGSTGVTCGNFYAEIKSWIIKDINVSAIFSTIHSVNFGILTWYLLVPLPAHIFWIHPLLILCTFLWARRWLCSFCSRLTGPLYDPDNCKWHSMRSPLTKTKNAHSSSVVPLIGRVHTCTGFSGVVETSMGPRRRVVRLLMWTDKSEVKYVRKNSVLRIPCRATDAVQRAQEADV